MSFQSHTEEKEEPEEIVMWLGQQILESERMGLSSG